MQEVYECMKKFIHEAASETLGAKYKQRTKKTIQTWRNEE